MRERERVYKLVCLGFRVRLKHDTCHSQVGGAYSHAHGTEAAGDGRPQIIYVKYFVSHVTSVGRSGQILLLFAIFLKIFNVHLINI